MTRAFRFGAGPGRLSDRASLTDSAQEIERLGYATFGMGDHFMMKFAPLPALQAAADATSTIRLTQTVLANDFRHPAVLAKDLATLDVLSEGRLEVGIGAGWMRAEYEQAGIPFDRPSTRIERLEEAVTVLKGLFDDGPLHFAGKHYTIDGLVGRPTPLQRPHPPVLIGGGGRKLLSVAGRQADIVQIMPGAASRGTAVDWRGFTAEAFAEKIGWVREAAGDRFARIELGVQLVTVTITDDAEQAYDAFLDDYPRQFGTELDDRAAAARELRSSPLIVIGTLDEVCARLVEIRAELGFSYLASPFRARPAALAPVIARLAGK